MISRHNIQKKKNIKIKIIFIALGGIAAFLIIIFLSFRRMILSPASAEDREIVLEIKKGEGVRQISSDLANIGAIKHPTVFIIYLKYTGLGMGLKAGRYNLNKNMNMVAITDIISGGKVVNNKVTIPEGLRVEEVAKKLDSEGIVKKDDFLEAIKKNYDYDFLKSKPKGQNLEGYLFPDTYFLSASISSDQIIKKMLNNFSNKFTPKMEKDAKSQGYSIHQIITLASIIEKEANKKEDRELVAGILKNRLKKDMPLQSDVTNHYIIKDWKKELTQKDLDIDSPYNTRKYKGLPPGPICNPSLESLKAAIYSKDSNYLYYLSAKNGTMYYSYTKEEHDLKKEKYLKN